MTTSWTFAPLAFLYLAAIVVITVLLVWVLILAIRALNIYIRKNTPPRA